MSDPRRASVQYGDLRGEAAADRSDGPSLRELAGELGVAGFPVGLAINRFTDANPNADNEAEFYLSIFTADPDAGYGVDAINQYVAQNRDTLLVREHSTKIDVIKLLDIFKRFNVTLFSKGIKAENMEVMETVNIDDQRAEQEYYEGDEED